MFAVLLGNLLSGIKTAKEIALEKKIIADYTEKIREIKFPQQDNWKSEWHSSVKKIISQISINWVKNITTLKNGYDFDFSLQISNMRIEIYQVYKNCSLIYANDKLISDVYVNDFKMYHMHFNHHKLPFNIWLNVIREILSIFDFDFDEQSLENITNDDAAENVWLARPIDFHPAVDVFISSTDQINGLTNNRWLNLKWKKTIVTGFDRKLMNEISTQVVLHTFFLGLTKNVGHINGINNMKSLQAYRNIFCNEIEFVFAERHIDCRFFNVQILVFRYFSGEKLHIGSGRSPANWTETALIGSKDQKEIIGNQFGFSDKTSLEEIWFLIMWLLFTAIELCIPCYEL